MSLLTNLIENNRNWAKRITETDPDFFSELSKQQEPDYLWIGCSDSRVPPTTLVKLKPGELFVHRNVANLVVHTDLNCLSVLQFAIDYLKVKHVIVCGHYGCGGVKAALENQKLGLIDNWLRHVQDVRDKYEAELNDIEDVDSRANRLSELNVFEQVINVCQTTVVQDAWERGQDLTVHGFVYDLRDGLMKELNLDVSSREEMQAARNGSA